jgi:site-specific recombinase XerD
MFRRGSVWWVSFVVNGKRYRTSTETSDRKLAQNIRHEIKARIAEGKWFDRLPGEEKTFKEMMDKYLEEHSSKKASARDFAGYSKKLNSFFGDYMVTEVTPSLIKEYKKKRREDGLKPASINRELAAMKKAFNLAIKEWEWIRENPVMKVSMEAENNARDRWLREGEEERLLGASPVWLRELIIFALNTGMRLSEILELKWREVDLSRKTVTVIRSKNGQKRTIPLNEKVSRLLLIKSISRSNEGEFVFPSQAYTMLSKYNVGRGFRKAARRAKVQDFRFHDLRHTFATRLVQAGKDLYKVQRLLGHKSGI